MKKKFRKQFHQQFKWYDQWFLLDAMILWIENAGKMHTKHGNLIRSEATGRDMKIVANVLKRIRDDNYGDINPVFECRNKRLSSLTGDKEYYMLAVKYQAKRRQADIDYAFDVMKKHLLSWWD